MAATDLLARIVGGGLCAGCGLCAAVAAKGRITMHIDAEGYARPLAAAALDAGEERVLRDMCPGIHLRHPPGLASYDPVWGPLVAVRTGHATDAQTRFQGASGGALSALLIHLLESGAVDYVLHNAASDEDPLLNRIQVSRTRGDVLAGAGSRYAPSAPLADIARHLDGSARFAFVGKPCDVAALRNLARRDARVDRRVPYMISFMCAGIPSRKGGMEILERFGLAHADVRAFSYRGRGWPGKATALVRDGRRFEMDYNTSWGTILNRHLQFRCKICPDGTGEFADVVYGDAWYSKDGYPDFEERDGRSLIISRTAAGEALLQACAAAGYIAMQPLPVAEIGRMQPYQETRKRMVLPRLWALRAVGRMAPNYRNLGLLRAARGRSLREHYRSFKGTVKRTLF